MKHYLFTIILISIFTILHCSSEKKDDTGTLLAAAALASSSSSSCGTLTLDSVTAHSKNNLMAIAKATTTASAQVAIEFSASGTETLTTSYSTAGTSHEITVMGMRANTQYAMKAKCGTAYSDAKTFTTGSLPSNAPTVTLVTKDNNSLGGIVVFGVGVGKRTNPWIRKVSAGNILVAFDDEVKTMKTNGDIVTTYDLSSLKSSGSYHHDAVILPNGNIMTLGYEYGTSTTGGNISGDKIVELDSSGNTKWEWSTFSYLDKERFPGSLANATKTYQGTSYKEWSHCNALYYSSTDSSVILSCRSQSWVIKIDYSTKAIKWIMGSNTGISSTYNKQFMTLQSGSWMTGQHAPVITSSGSILLYDNRNESNGTTSMSRAVQFTLNETAYTATQSWEYVAPKYTMSLGDVDELSNKNILICSGGPGTDQNARILEVNSSGTDVWQIQVSNTSVYRAERISWSDFL